MDHKRSLLASIHSLEDQKQALLQDLSALEAELQAKQAQYYSVLNEETYLYRLPDELISSIFLTCQAMTRLSRKISTPFEIVASHVSHRWRDVVLSTPLLWNVIDLRIRPTNHVPGLAYARLEAHLARSLYTCLLDITLEFLMQGDISGYLCLLAAHSERWKKLSLLTRYEQVGDIQAALSHARAPVLEHLSLSIGKPLEGPRRPYQNVYPSILPSSANTLSFVRLGGLALGHSHPPTPCVTTLHLDGWTRHFLTHEQFKTILEATTALENLSLNQLYVRPPRDPLTILQPVKLPYLHRLRVRGASWGVSWDLLEVPNLQSLSLQDIDTFDLKIMSSVQSLSVESCGFGGVDLRNLLNAFPNLAILSIDESIPDIYSMFLPDPALPKPWPHLQSISLRNLQPNDIGHFCNMVFDFKETHEKFSQVYLDRRSRTVLRTKHRLDWLQDRVKVGNKDFADPWPPGLGYEDPHDLLE
ncbi:hypothetical protein CVT26_005571 [Gymnopilus dilepis]|uniref:Uncharacterized protein n=1 Tax=Gymnopilus dilepis TaxID=231916 RepID=A0A409XZP2_9AGAR|nr:hypothetical protein CVT26_005571 [Gymnopilus dilepis]